MRTAHDPRRSAALSDDVLAEICRVLATNPAVQRARIFGSRALGRARPSSDIDLAIDGPLDDQALADLRGQLEALPFIWCFDVVGMARLRHEALRAHIDRVGVEIYHRTESRLRSG